MLIYISRGNALSKTKHLVSIPIDLLYEQQIHTAAIFDSSLNVAVEIGSNQSQNDVCSWDRNCH